MSSSANSAIDHRILLAVCVVALVSLVPVWSVRHPPLADYPNHLARMHVLMAKGADAQLNRHYEVRWAAIPNLAIDLTVPSLGRLVGLENAGKLFISATLVLLLTGIVALHYAIHRAWSAWPLLGALLVYNPFFLWGFLNYLFGLGLAFWLSAAWLLHRSSRAAWVVFPVAALTLFFMHLMPFCIYLLIIGTYEVSVALRDGSSAGELSRRMLQVAMQAAPALGIFVLWSPTSSAGSGSLFSEPAEKAGAFLHLFANYVPFLDFKLTLMPVTLFFLAGLVTGAVKIDRRMLLALGGLTLVFFALPHGVFSSGGASERLVLPIAMLLVASTNWTLSKIALNASIVGIVALIFLGRMVVLERYWLRYDRNLTTYREALRAVPQGAHLMPLHFSARAGREDDKYRWHVASFAVIDRDALVPTMFAYRTQQPILFSAEAKARLRGAGPQKTMLAEGQAPDWDAIAKSFDHVVVVGSPGLALTVPDSFVVVSSAEDVHVLRIAR